MKKQNWIFIFLMLLFVSATMYQQNVYTYKVMARGGISIGDESVSGTNIGLIDSVAVDFTADLATIFGNAGDSIGIYTPYSQRSTDVPLLLTDTSLYHAFVIGSGNANDTTLFSTGDAYGIKWDGSHNLVITKVTAVNGSASKDIDIALLHDANYKDATPTAVLSADLTVTSNTTGDDATSFASATIAPGQWLWIRIDQSTTPPLQTIVNVYGYLTE